MKKTFYYRAKDLSNNLREGVIEATDTMAAVAELRRQNLYIIHIKPHPSGIQKLKEGIGFYYWPSVSSKELAVFCQQLSTLIKAGVPILKALHLLTEHTENKGLKNILNKVVVELNSGSTLGETFEQHPDLFPQFFIGIIKAGEESGKLETVLDSLGKYYKKEHAIKAKLKTIVIYPLLVMAFSAIVLTVLLLFVLPNFVGTLQSFAVELPWITKVLVDLGAAVNKFWYLFFIPLLIIVAAAVYYPALLRENTKAKNAIDKLVFSLPLFGPLFIKVYMARFCRSLAHLIENGVPLLTALETTKEIINNSLISGVITEVQREVQRGGTVAETLQKSTVFPRMVSRLVAVGEQSGDLQRMLDNVADFYEDEVDVTVSRLSVVLEPLLLLVTAFFVALIMAAMVLPMFNVIEAINY
ncbi:type II secretion system F family protein [Desulfofalx alkaliphila]|uniref:type II secretion system F family protein n=1 Tax=Desulfofalx alkaliphila TaxID=105483 RepID=UPI0004E1A758|nr:type II secretion system F family protein [Desulfofalx alkaliphila]